MKFDQKIEVSLFELPLIAATRLALGIGIGMLVADRVDNQHRQIVGKTLVIAGALSTIPLLWAMMPGLLKLQHTKKELSDSREQGRQRNLAEQGTNNW